MKKIKSIVYNVMVNVETGLHIGAGDTGIGIGGLDNQVIKDKNGLPYIPGSSLKGKMRSLLEVSEGKFDKRSGGPHEFCGDILCPICRAFGPAKCDRAYDDSIKNLGPTRILVRDLKIKDNGGGQKDPQLFLEQKNEVQIDRNTGKASHFGPRAMERVVTGAVFEGEIVFRVFDTLVSNNSNERNYDNGARDEEIAKELFETRGGKLKELLEADYLGGYGSRGSGQVKISFTRQN